MANQVLDPVRNDGPRAAATQRRRWRYDSAGSRDQRLDLLRGYALAAMAINHFGLSQSYLHEASGRSGFLVSAAEAFLVISGFTLGYISIGRTPEQATTRLSKRTWTVYLATVGISLGLGLLAMTTPLQLWGQLDTDLSDGPWPWIAQVLTLRTAFNGADILIAYVLYLTAAIGALRLMTAGRTHIVVAAVGGAYLLSQVAGSGSTALGFASFRALLPNAPLFFGGLVLGYHRHRINTMWHTIPFHRGLDLSVVAAAVVLTWMHAGEWATWPWLGEQIVGPDLVEPLGQRETDMPWVPLVVVLLFLRVAWLIVDACWLPLRTAFGWLLLPLGEASLFTFTMHLLAIPAIVNLPFWTGDDLERTTATLWVMAYLGLIYAAVLARQRVLTWLRADAPGRASIRNRAPVAATAGLLIAVVVAGASFTEFDDFVDEAEGIESTRLNEPDLGEEVGVAIDGLAAGEISVSTVLEMLPPTVAADERAELAERLAEDPRGAEDELFNILASQP